MIKNTKNTLAIMLLATFLSQKHYVSKEKPFKMVRVFSDKTGQLIVHYQYNYFDYFYHIDTNKMEILELNLVIYNQLLSIFTERICIGD